MTRLTFFLIIAVICATFMPLLTAVADTAPTENQPPKSCVREQLCQAICQIEKVDDCRVAVFGAYAFVAVKTKGVVTATAAKQVTQEVKNTVTELCPKLSEVYVSTSVKAFTAIDNVNNRKELHELLDLFGVELKDNFFNQRPKRLPDDVHPPMNLPDECPRSPVKPDNLCGIFVAQ